MNIDFINVLALFSGIFGVYIAFITAKEIIFDKKQQKVEEAPDYKRIKTSTYKLEHERERNKGDHFEDENVYLRRAEEIRKNTSFFSFIND